MALKKQISVKPTQRLASWVLMIAVVSPLTGCSNPEDVVVNGTLPQDKSITVGKVFATSFDDGEWSSTEDKKGRVIVTYTGKISKELHEKAVKKSLEARIPDTEREVIQKAIKKMGINSDFITSLTQKYDCEAKRKKGFFGGRNFEIWCSGNNNKSNFQGYMKELREEVEGPQIEYLKNNTWPEGAPVEFNFRLNKDGTSFKIYSVKSETWEKGKVIKAYDILEMSKVFETLYEEMVEVKGVTLTAAINTQSDRAEELLEKGTNKYRDKKYSEAFDYFKEAADLGNNTAKYELGIFYLRGRSVPKDVNEGLRLFKEGADQGLPGAQNLLAKYYAADQTHADGKLALKYAKKAILQAPDKWNYVRTLAAAYARNGQYDLAITTQNLAINLLENEKEDVYNRAKKLKRQRKRLRLFQKNKPFTYNYWK